MDEHTKRQQATGHAVSTELHENEKRKQEFQRRQETVKQTYQEIKAKGFGPNTQSQKDYDKAYQYAVGQHLEQNKGKPLSRDTDVKVAEKFLSNSEGKIDSHKLKEAIKNHSPIAATVPEKDRHEYASAAISNAVERHRKNIPREENTRVKSPHPPNSHSKELSQEELQAIQMHKEKER
jgi:hypothetical protein